VSNAPDRCLKTRIRGRELGIQDVPLGRVGHSEISITNSNGVAELSR
jgi:hypothetical protein